ncbi:MAG: SDR family oxidoreductase [Clostridiales bacterium]|nr:SDR family oxidoreductase [Clostridiales bacterium]
MKWDNSKKAVLITGSSRGIGRAIAESFAAPEYNVILNCVNNVDKMNEVLEKIKKTSPNSAGFQFDVADINAVNSAVDEINNKFGGVDILINNAGISLRGLFQDMPDKDWKWLFDVNVFGMFNLTKAVLPHMISQKKGVIINISSMWGQSGASCEAVYSASKGAVDSFTKALAKELGPCGIRTNAVSCGCIETEMNGFLSAEEKNELAEEIPLMRFGSPKEIGELVRFLASDKASYINGQIIRADGGFI